MFAVFWNDLGLWRKKHFGQRKHSENDVKRDRARLEAEDFVDKLYSMGYNYVDDIQYVGR